MSVKIPDTHKGLVELPIVATLATMMPNGQPQTTVIWRKYNGETIDFITSRGTQKEKNIQANPQVSLMTIDPQNPYRYLEIRGEINELIEAGAGDLLDEITLYYTGKQHYYGDVVPADQKDVDVDLICKIRPTKVIAKG